MQRSKWAGGTLANRLVDSTSPYLLQHKDNPVDWFPWGPEPFEEARRRDVPVLVSVGYSSCHWCHVMAHESFEDPETASIMNERFVNVKVDREERPDVDEVYMTALQAMTGHGGWPMTVFCTPEGKPFFAGTYFPKTERGGLPSFKDLLIAISETYAKNRGEVVEQAEKLAKLLEPPTLDAKKNEGLELKRVRDLIETAFEALFANFDEEFGGFGGAPKFPQAPNLEFILRYHWASSDPRARRVLRSTLDAMALGGLYDQIAGGFFRYSVDRRWVIPHFEKMLYDNAQLARVYLWAGQHFGSTFYRRIACETADFVIDTLTDPQGGFCSALDADTYGVEGGTYTFSYEELKEILPENHLDFAVNYFGVSREGNFEGTNHLRARVPAEDLSETDRQTLQQIRQVLLEVRKNRSQPNCDDKVIASWNGLAIHALADIGRATANTKYLDAAVSCATFIKEKMVGPLGLVHTWRKGKTSPQCFSTDLASVGLGCIAVFEATGDWGWACYARDLALSIVENFIDTKDGLVFLTPEHDVVESGLISRPKPLLDNAEPGPNSLSAMLLFKLARLFDDASLQDAANRIVHALSPVAGRHPSAFGGFLSAVLFNSRPPAEIVIAGEVSEEMRAQVLSSYLPDVTLVSGIDKAPEGLPLIEGKQRASGQGAVYVCSNYVCEEPSTEPSALRRAIANLSAREMTVA
ncbi:MAG: thioredoxin domain-containing protein [Acidimicrobiia bacterium]